MELNNVQMVVMRKIVIIMSVQLINSNVRNMLIHQVIALKNRNYVMEKPIVLATKMKLVVR